jgi:putative selenium metabolism protein SsnA
MGAEVAALVGGTLVELDPPRVERRDVTMHSGRIAEVLLPGAPLPAGASVVDATGCVITPAFVVGHTHLYSALACGMPMPAAAPRNFREILERIWWKVDKALDDELVATSALVGAIEAARRGVACVIDHHASPRAIDGSLDRIAAALDRVGLRGALCYETSDRDGRGARDAGLRENERFADRARRGETMHRALIGAHAPFTLEDDTLDALRDLADRAKVGLHVHVAEDTTDGEDAARRGTTLEARLERLGVGRPGSIVGHGVHLGAAERASLATRGAWIATNTRSNMNNAVGLAPASGARVALGTDGIGADMIAEAQAHFFRHAEARDDAAGEALTRLAGAQRLASLLFDGEERAPRIAAGERADLAVLTYDPPTPLDASNLFGHVIFGWSTSCVRDTIVGGRFVLRDRAVVGIDERRVAHDARAAAARLWQRMSSIGS